MSVRELVVLGTASQAPSRRRNHNGYLLGWDGRGVLFDPGEGTHRLRHAGAFNEVADLRALLAIRAVPPATSPQNGGGWSESGGTGGGGGSGSGDGRCRMGLSSSGLSHGG
jgi:hypothetical protein